MRLVLALLAFAIPTTFAQTKEHTPSTVRSLPKPVPAKDAAAVKFSQFELKDAKLINVLRVMRAKAYNQGNLIDFELNDLPNGALGDRTVSVSLKEITVGQLMQTLSQVADFKFTIKGNTITVETK